MDPFIYVGVIDAKELLVAHHLAQHVANKLFESILETPIFLKLLHHRLIAAITSVIESFQCHRSVSVGIPGIVVHRRVCGERICMIKHIQLRRVYVAYIPYNREQVVRSAGVQQHILGTVAFTGNWQVSLRN
jgi:hypothetical protein